MAYGLQIFDGAGVNTLSITDRLTRIAGVYSVYVPADTTGSSNVSTWVSIPNMSADGTWGAFLTAWTDIGYSDYAGVPGLIQIENGGMRVYNYSYAYGITYVIQVFKF